MLQSTLTLPASNSQAGGSADTCIHRMLASFQLRKCKQHQQHEIRRQDMTHSACQELIGPGLHNRTAPRIALCLHTGSGLLSACWCYVCMVRLMVKPIRFVGRPMCSLIDTMQTPTELTLLFHPAMLASKSCLAPWPVTFLARD